MKSRKWYAFASTSYRSDACFVCLQLTIVREGTTKSKAGEQLGLQDDDVDLMMQKLDIDGNGDISFQEFSRVCFQLNRTRVCLSFSLI